MLHRASPSVVKRSLHAHTRTPSDVQNNSTLEKRRPETALRSHADWLATSPCAAPVWEPEEVSASAPLEDVSVVDGESESVDAGGEEVRVDGGRAVEEVPVIPKRPVLEVPEDHLHVEFTAGRSVDRVICGPCLDHVPILNMCAGAQ